MPGTDVARPDLYPDGLKSCTRCGKTKPVGKFKLPKKVGGRPNTNGVRDSWCYACNSEVGRENRRLKEAGVEKPPSRNSGKLSESELYPNHEKSCSTCGLIKPLTAFHIPRMLNGKRNTKVRSPQCRECLSASHVSWAVRNPDKKRQSSRESYFRCAYGLEPKDYERMFKEQNGLCRICARPPTISQKTLRVDHDHKTGEVRGLLCHQCNVGLGHFEDNPAFLSAALAYISTGGQND